MTKQLQQQIDQVKEVQTLFSDTLKLVVERMNEQQALLNKMSEYLQFKDNQEKQDYSVPILTIGNDVMLLKQNVQAVNSKLIELEKNIYK